MKPCKALRMEAAENLYLSSGLILERARKPDALYFALGLSYFAVSEPGRLSLMGIYSKCFC